MIDLEDALREHARAWRAALCEPTDLDGVVAAAVRAPRAGRRRSAAMLAAAAVVVLVAVGAVVLHQRGGHDRAQPTTNRSPRVPKSITVHGTKLRYVGDVPWGDAIADPSDPRRFSVFADDVSACVHPVERVFTSETPTTVTVAVAGYLDPRPPGITPCSLGYVRPAPISVTLARPLGSRRLVDATTRRPHRALVPAAVPQVHDVPARCALPLTWDEKSGLAVRSYDRGGRSGCGVMLQYGPTHAVPIPTHAHDGVVRCPALLVGGIRVGCWHYHDPKYTGTGFLLRWEPRPGAAIWLEVASPPPGIITRAHALAVARSVR